MDEVLFGWSLLIFIFGWRWLCKIQSVQDCLHSDKMNRFVPVNWMLQWSTLLMVSIGLLIFRTFMDVVIFDYIRFKFLDPEEVLARRDGIQNQTNGTQLSPDQLNDLELPDILRWFSLFAPPCGVLAFVLCAWQTVNMAKKGKQLKEQEGSTRIFRASKRQNMVMMIMALPVVFIAMSMRAQIRVWAVMTGSSWLPYASGGRLNHRMVTWDEINTAELTTYHSDISLANFFQLQAVGAFGLLVMSYLKDAPRKYRRILQGAGLLGLWCYLVIATIVFAADFYRALLAAAEAQMRNSGHVSSWVSHFLMMDKVTSQDVEKNFLDPIQPMNLVFTLLCVANMLVYERMPEIEKHLGEATLKFNATKFLLIVTHVQPIIIGRLTGIAWLQEHVFHGWIPSETCAALIHTSLLPYECLIVVIVNGVFWGAFKNDIDDRFFGYYPHKAMEHHEADAPHGKTPLLGEFECLNSEGEWVNVTVVPADEALRHMNLDHMTIRQKKTKAEENAAEKCIHQCKNRCKAVLYPTDDTDVSEEEDGAMTKAGKHKMRANKAASEKH